MKEHAKWQAGISSCGPAEEGGACGFLGRKEISVKGIRNPRIMTFVFFSVAAFCAFSFYFLDIPVANLAKSPPGEISDVFEVVTFLGRSTSYLVASCLLFIFFRYVRENGPYAERFLFVFLSVGVSGLLTDGLKTVFGRCRPKMFYLNGQYGFDFLQFHTKYEMNSFPSGHATTVGALATVLWIVCPRYGIAGTLLAVLVMASRIVLGAHFVSDVVFGAYVGFVTAVFFKMLSEKKTGASLRCPDLPRSEEGP